MYNTLLFVHSLTRWAVLLILAYAIYLAWKGYKNNTAFTPHDNLIRHSTATIVQVQFVIGVILYVKSPLIRGFWQSATTALQHMDLSFFGLIHAILMIAAVGVVTTGSAKAKRMLTDHAKHRTMLVWFSIALLLILIAIPWPFSPLAARPLLRPY